MNEMYTIYSMIKKEENYRVSINNAKLNYRRLFSFESEVKQKSDRDIVYSCITNQHHKHLRIDIY